MKTTSFLLSNSIINKRLGRNLVAATDDVTKCTDNSVSYYCLSNSAHSLTPDERTVFNEGILSKFIFFENNLFESVFQSLEFSRKLTVKFKKE